MTIESVKGDIFNARTQTIVNTVNCEGVMGKGLALEFKKRYPKMFEEYKRACEQGKLKIGELLPPYKVNEGRWILNFPTKNKWRFKSKLEYIEAGLIFFAQKYKEWGIKSIAFPRLGCQHGGLDWKEVKPLMTRYLEHLPDLRVLIYSQTPRDRTEKKARRRRPKASENDQKQRKLVVYAKPDK